MPQKSSESTERYNAYLLFEFDAISAYIDVLCCRSSFFRESSSNFFAIRPYPWIFKLNHYRKKKYSELIESPYHAGKKVIA